MAKQLQAVVRFHATGGKATAAPPVGTALGKYGLNLGQFVKEFNDRTKQFMDMRIPVVVRVYSDRSFDLETKSPHSVDLIKKAIGITKGSTHVPKEKDLNAREVEQSVRILAGPARRMGVDVVD